MRIIVHGASYGLAGSVHGEVSEDLALRCGPGVLTAEDAAAMGGTVALWVRERPTRLHRLEQEVRRSAVALVVSRCSPDERWLFGQVEGRAEVLAQRETPDYGTWTAERWVAYVLAFAGAARDFARAEAQHTQPRVRAYRAGVFEAAE